MKNTTTLIVVMTFMILSCNAQKLSQVTASTDSFNKMSWYEDARFGLFIHWGAYSQLDGEYNGKVQKDPKGEWIMRNLKIPLEEYATEISKKFNPTLFNAESWVKAAYEAGIKYIVITTKHHDGFALFDSEISKYNVVDYSQFGRDIIGELSEECKKYGLRLGVYYSQAQDWHHPGGLAAKNRWDTAQDGDWDEYFKTIAKPQVHELLNNYKPISLIWFDSKSQTVNKELAKDFEKELKEEYPKLILNPRLHKGDFNTFEQTIPGILDDGYNELCITHNRSWSFKPSDNNWKEPQFMLTTLIHMASMGGNFLFNVGPNPEGEFPSETLQALTYIGDWMNVNSEAIYGTSKSPFYKLDFGTATLKEFDNNKTKIFLHIFDWPEDLELCVKGLNNQLSSAYMLDGKKPISFEKSGEDVRLSGLPEKSPHETASVIVLEIDEPLNIDPGYLEFKKDSIALKPQEALLTTKPQFDYIPFVIDNKDFSYFENWKNRYPHPRFKNTANEAHWKVVFPEKGSYKVWLHCATQTSTNVINVSSAQSIKTTLPNTGGMDNFKTVYLGEIRLDKGLQTITLTGGKKMENWDYVRIGNLYLERTK